MFHLIASILGLVTATPVVSAPPQQITDPQRDDSAFANYDPYIINSDPYPYHQSATDPPQEIADMVYGEAIPATNFNPIDMNQYFQNPYQPFLHSLEQQQYVSVEDNNEQEALFEFDEDMDEGMERKKASKPIIVLQLTTSNQLVLTGRQQQLAIDNVFQPAGYQGQPQTVDYFSQMDKNYQIQLLADAHNLRSQMADQLVSIPVNNHEEFINYNLNRFCHKFEYYQYQLVDNVHRYESVAGDIIRKVQMGVNIHAMLHVSSRSVAVFHEQILPILMQHGYRIVVQYDLQSGYGVVRQNHLEYFSGRALVSCNQDLSNFNQMAREVFLNSFIRSFELYSALSVNDWQNVIGQEEQITNLQKNIKNHPITFPEVDELFLYDQQTLAFDVQSKALLNKKFEEGQVYKYEEKMLLHVKRGREPDVSCEHRIKKNRDVLVRFVEGLCQGA